MQQRRLVGGAQQSLIALTESLIGAAQALQFVAAEVYQHRPALELIAGIADGLPQSIQAIFAHHISRPSGHHFGHAVTAWPQCHHDEGNVRAVFQQGSEHIQGAKGEVFFVGQDDICPGIQPVS